MMRVTVDATRCIASGQCVLAAPEVFDQDGDGTVVVLVERPRPEQEDSVREAALVCPAAVIGISPA
ncbi:ferredoxin [Plantactinospora sp. WMMB334]|uniref:ferredoxin n=1 Tax=Plantactinospora sp. WMMB334 TaxID=3404119 RepID=UPI003B93D568